jgi:hypothetical protein
MWCKNWFEPKIELTDKVNELVKITDTHVITNTEIQTVFFKHRKCGVIVNVSQPKRQPRKCLRVMTRTGNLSQFTKIGTPDLLQSAVSNSLGLVSISLTILLQMFFQVLNLANLVTIEYFHIAHGTTVCPFVGP